MSQSKTPIVDRLHKRLEGKGTLTEFAALDALARALEQHCDALAFSESGDALDVAREAYLVWKREQLK